MINVLCDEATSKSSKAAKETKSVTKLAECSKIACISIYRSDERKLVCSRIYHKTVKAVSDNSNRDNSLNTFELVARNVGEGRRRNR